MRTEANARPLAVPDAVPGPRLPRLWIIYVCVAATTLVAYPFVPLSVQDWLYQAAAPIGALGVLYGAKRNVPAGQRSAFWALGLGIMVSWVADLIFLIYLKTVGEAPYPSIADAIYILGYALYITAFVSLIRGRKAGRDFGGMIDTAIALTAFALIEFVLLIYPNLWDVTQPLLTRAVSTAYPVADILILGCLARLLVSPGARTTSFRMFVVAFSLLLGADSVYGIMMQNGTYEAGLIDLCWLAAYLLYGAAVLHPSVRTLAHRAPDVERHLSGKRIVVLACLALVAPVAYALTSMSPQDLPVAAAISVGGALLFMLVIARVAGLVRRLAASMGQLETEQEARAALTRRTFWVSENERNRLASDLHDGPIQQLTALSYRVEALRGKVGKDHAGFDEGFAGVQSALSSEIGDMRRLMASLRPAALIERGLEATLSDHLAITLKDTGVTSKLNFELLCRPEHEVETVVYRVIQEAIANALKHAPVTRIGVSLREDGGFVHLVVTDDGKLRGATTPGLEGMRERVEMSGGSFSVASDEGVGTTVRACVAMGGIL